MRCLHAYLLHMYAILRSLSASELCMFILCMYMHASCKAFLHLSGLTGYQASLQLCAALIYALPILLLPLLASIPVCVLGTVHMAVVGNTCC